MFFFIIYLWYLLLFQAFFTLTCSMYTLITYIHVLTFPHGSCLHAYTHSLTSMHTLIHLVPPCIHTCTYTFSHIFTICLHAHTQHTCTLLNNKLLMNQWVPYCHKTYGFSPLMWVSLLCRIWDLLTHNSIISTTYTILYTKLYTILYIVHYNLYSTLHSILYTKLYIHYTSTIHYPKLYMY